MLQIISGKFFREVELYKTQHRNVLYSNATLVNEVSTLAGSVSPMDPNEEVNSLLYEVEERLEAVTNSGKPEVIVSAGGEYLANDFASILTLIWIVDSGSASDRILQLEGIKYNFKEDRDKMIWHGFSAQEVKDIIPELVFQDEEGIYSMNYVGLIPYLVEALKEQEDRIQRIEEMLNIKPILKGSTITGSTNSDLSNLSSDYYLGQNTPNPFDQITTIKYQVPQITSNAMINIYNLNGSQVRSYQIYQSGIGEISIPASELEPGIFIYNLIVDGREISSKRMILTD